MWAGASQVMAQRPSVRGTENLWSIANALSEILLFLSVHHLPIKFHIANVSAIEIA